MQSLSVQLLEHTLVSPEFSFGPVNITNMLGVPVRCGFVDTTGNIVLFWPMDNTPTPANIVDAPVNAYWVVAAPDGALFGVLPGLPGGQLGQALDLTLSTATLQMSGPGDIGPIPDPTSDVLIPSDTPPVVVGYGQVAGGFIVRSQYWKRATDSISLAPQETVQVGFTSSNGMQQTTSDQTTVSSSLSVSASAGWGPISTSISASLSQSNTTFQQFVTTQEETRYESRTYQGDPNDMAILMHWQMMDVVTVYNASSVAQASVINAAHPTIIRKYPAAKKPLKPITRKIPNLKEIEAIYRLQREGRAALADR